MPNEAEWPQTTPSSQLLLAFEVKPDTTLLNICQWAWQEDIRLDYDGEL